MMNDDQFSLEPFSSFFVQIWRSCLPYLPCSVDRMTVILFWSKNVILPIIMICMKVVPNKSSADMMDF